MSFYPNEIACGVCFPPSPISTSPVMQMRELGVVRSSASRLHWQSYRALRVPVEPYREYTSLTAGEKPRNVPGRAGVGECNVDDRLPQTPNLFCFDYAMGACPCKCRCDRVVHCDVMALCEENDEKIVGFLVARSDSSNRRPWR